MPLEHILDEIKKRELNKEQLFNQLLQESKEIIAQLHTYKDSPTAFRPTLPAGVVGRRLGDKIFHLEKSLEECEKIEKTSLKDLEKLEKALFLLSEHLKLHTNIYPLENPLTIPDALEDLKNEFIILQSLETNFKNSYIENCVNTFKQQMLETHDRLEKLEIKQTFEVYLLMGRNMPFSSIFRLKSLNEEYGKLLSPGYIAREFKVSDERLWFSQEEYQKTLDEREKFKESAKHLTHLQKCEAKSKAYLAEIDKHLKKMEHLDEESRQEMQELVSSYHEAHKIMQEEISKIKEFISREYGIDNVDAYHKKSMDIQVKIANFEIETKKLEKRCALLENVLNDIHESRKRSQKSLSADPEMRKHSLSQGNQTQNKKPY